VIRSLRRDLWRSKFEVPGCDSEDEFEDIYDAFILFPFYFCLLASFVPLW